jgi:hypothetical protein
VSGLTQAQKEAARVAVAKGGSVQSVLPESINSFNTALGNQARYMQGVLIAQDKALPQPIE